MKKSYNQNYKISVITVVKNGKKNIEENIKSLINQTYKNYEHIIIDGLSDDGTIQIIEKYKNNISKFISEEDNGLYDAMNKGISFCSGDIIGILNSDDYFYPNALEIVNKYFSDNKSIDFLFGAVNKYNKIYSKFNPKKIYWTFGFYTSHSVGFFIRKNSQNKLGNYSLKYKYSSDYDLFYRMIVHKKMTGISTKKNEVLGFFRDGGLSDQISYKDFLDETTQIRIDNKQNPLIVKMIYWLRYLKRMKLK